MPENSGLVTTGYEIIDGVTYVLLTTGVVSTAFEPSAARTLADSLKYWADAIDASAETKGNHVI